jgi:hypothetical protein
MAVEVVGINVLELRCVTSIVGHAPIFRKAAGSEHRADILLRPLISDSYASKNE